MSFLPDLRSEPETQTSASDTFHLHLLLLLLTLLLLHLILRPPTHLLVPDGVEAGRLDLVAVVMVTHVTQHHHGAEQQGGGVGQIQTGDVGGGSVDLQHRDRK